MSQQPIAHSADLIRLRNDGYTICIKGGYLVVGDVPFVDSEGAVHADGALAVALTLAGDVADQPPDHTAHFIGGVPCDTDGQPLSRIINQTQTQDLGNGLVATCYLSAKPHGSGQYDDYHHKVTTYVAQIAGQAHAVDPAATARRYRPVETDSEDQGPFKYADTASSRAGIAALNEILGEERIGLVGLGGTGEYLLDAVTKSHVAEIHIFDGDEFLTHNAFRAPGAPSIEQLNARPAKVDHFGDIYDQMRVGIIRHPYPVTESQVSELSDMTFVFIAIDDAVAKAPIIDYLIKSGIPFIDVGMGVEMVNGRLTGSLRTTLVTPDQSSHAYDRISTVSVHRDDDDYRSNIQIAELNMANAAQAVIAWKKYRGFYADWDLPHHIMYSIASNRIVNDEYAPSPETEGNESKAA